MGGDDKKADAGVILSLGAAIGVAALALSRRAEAAPPGTVVSLDEETLQLLIAIAQQTGKIDDVINAINAISLNGGQGWPPNCNSFRTFGMPCALANTPYQLPDLVIPDGFALALRANPANTGMIYIGESPAICININQAWPLMPGDMVTYNITNCDLVYYSGTFATDVLNCTVEYRRGS